MQRQRLLTGRSSLKTKNARYPLSKDEHVPIRLAVSIDSISLLATTESKLSQRTGTFQWIISIIQLGWLSIPCVG